MRDSMQRDRVHADGAEACPDTPRYKALGNGWAVNCARWICRRIRKHDEKHREENAHGNE